MVEGMLSWRENDSGVVGGTRVITADWVPAPRWEGGCCDRMVWEDLAEIVVVVTVMRRRESRG